MPLTFLLALTFAATLFAGGPSPLGDMLAQLLAVVLLLVLLLQRRAQLAGIPPWAWTLIAAAVALPLLQLIPGGGGLAGGAARAAVDADLAVAAVDRGAWAPLSLNPAATEAWLWSLLPPIAAFLAAATMDRRELGVVIWALLGLALFQVLLGAVQSTAGAGSAAFALQSLYPAHNTGRAIGSFANINHTGAFILMLLPLAWARLLAAWERKRFDQRARPGDALAVPMLSVLIVLLLVGLILTRSRAMMGLGMISIAVGLLLIAPRAATRGGGRFMTAVTLIGLLLALELGLFAALSRFERDPMADLRWTMVAIGADAIVAWWPWGSGLGTFVDAFAAFLPLEAAGTHYINHAHNDYVELVLEAGLPGAVVAAAFVIAILAQSIRILRRPQASRSLHLLSLAAAVGLITILLHSLVDYPLRSCAVAVVFGVLGGIVVAPSAPQR